MNQQEFFGFTDFMDSAANKINSVCSTVKTAINVDNISKDIQGGITTVSDGVQTAINVPIGYLNKGVSFVGDTVTSITDTIGDTVSNTFNAFAGGILSTIDKTVIDAKTALAQLDAADPDQQFPGLKYKIGDVASKIQLLSDSNDIYIKSVNSLITTLNAYLNASKTAPAGQASVATLTAIITYIQSAADSTSDANQKTYLTSLVNLLTDALKKSQDNINPIVSGLNSIATVEQVITDSIKSIKDGSSNAATSLTNSAAKDPSSIDQVMFDLNAYYARVSTDGITPLANKIAANKDSSIAIRTSLVSSLNQIVIYKDLAKILSGEINIDDATNMSDSALLTLINSTTVDEAMKIKVVNALVSIIGVYINAIKTVDAAIINCDNLKNAAVSLNTALTSTAVVTESFYFVEPEKTDNPSDQRLPFYHTRREIEGQFPIDIYQFKDIPVIMYSQQTISGKPIQYYKMNNLSYFTHTTMDGMTVEYVQYPVANKPDFQMYSYSFAGQDEPLVFSNYPVPGVNVQDLGGLQQMGIVPGTNFGTSLSAFAEGKTIQENFGILDQITDGMNQYIIDPVKGAFTTAFNSAADFVRGIMGPIKAAANVVASGIKCVYDNVLNIAKQLPKIPGAIKDVAVKAFDGIKDVVVTAVDGVVGTVKNIGTQIYKIGGSVISGVTKTASGIFNLIAAGVKTVIDTVKLIIAGITRLIKFLMALPGKIKDFAQKAWNSISGIATGIYTKIKNGIMSIFNGSDGEDAVPTIELDQNDPNIIAANAAKTIRDAVIADNNALGNKVLDAIPADKSSERVSLSSLITATSNVSTQNIDGLTSAIKAVIPNTNQDALDALNKLSSNAKNFQTAVSNTAKIQDAIPTDKLTGEISSSLLQLALLSTYPSKGSSAMVNTLVDLVNKVIPDGKTDATTALNSLKSSATSSGTSAEFFGFIDNTKWYKSWWFILLIVLLIAIGIYLFMRKRRMI